MVDLSTLSEVAPGIFYTPHEFVLADDALIRFLKDKARSTPARRARLCAHPAPEADQHDMLIVSLHDTYVAPHRHPKSEGFVVIEGEADLLLFEADGRLARRITMGPASSGLPMFYRMPAGRYHSLAIRSEVLVFVESTRGPFSPLGYGARPLGLRRPPTQSWARLYRRAAVAGGRQSHSREGANLSWKRLIPYDASLGFRGIPASPGAISLPAPTCGGSGPSSAGAISIIRPIAPSLDPPGRSSAWSSW